jgi:streptogramin lyase
MKIRLSAGRRLRSIAILAGAPALVLGLTAGTAAGPDGALWFTNESTNSIGRITTTVTP